MKIYTRSGDDGRTALFGGGRVSKDDARVSAYGGVDELNAALGWCVARVDDEGIRRQIETVQHDLFALGSDLATPPAREGRKRPVTPVLPVDRVAEMETWMDEADTELPALSAFIVPGGSEGAAALHVARTICRRAERAVVHLSTLEPVSGEIVTYLNRLSDLLFTFARLENHRAGRRDIEWIKPAPPEAE